MGWGGTHRHLFEFFARTNVAPSLPPCSVRSPRSVVKAAFILSKQRERRWLSSLSPTPRRWRSQIYYPLADKEGRRKTEWGCNYDARTVASRERLWWHSSHVGNRLPPSTPFCPPLSLSFPVLLIRSPSSLSAFGSENGNEPSSKKSSSRRRRGKRRAHRPSHSHSLSLACSSVCVCEGSWVFVRIHSPPSPPSFLLAT